MIVREPCHRGQVAEDAGRMRSRFGIVAQAVGVAAWAAVVYFAFLQPGDPNPLSGIEVEGDLPAETPPIQAANHNRGRPSPDERGARTRRAAGIRLAPTSPTSPGGGLPTVTTDPDTPAGSQYGNAVARVLGLVGRSTQSIQAGRDPAP
jgi:hypothetical protein